MATPLKYPTTQNYVQKTLNAQLLAGVTAAATLNNVTSIQNLPGVMIVDRIDSNGVETPAKREVILYQATSGSTTVTLTRNVDGSGTDQDHATGAIVEFGADVVWAQAVIDGLAQVLVASTGALDITKVADLSTAQNLANKTLTSPNIIVGSDAAGDLYARNAGASLTRVPKGNLLQRLEMNASLPAWTGAPQRTPYVVLTDAATMYLDFAVASKFMATIVPSASRTFLATNATLGDVAMLRVTYASTASLSLVLLAGAGASVSWPGNTLPTPTATVLKTDVFGFACNSTLPRFDAFIMGQNL